jgi:hypothetical protein
MELAWLRTTTDRAQCRGTVAVASLKPVIPATIPLIKAITILRVLEKAESFVGEPRRRRDQRLRITRIET